MSFSEAAADRNSPIWFADANQLGWWSSGRRRVLDMRQRHDERRALAELGLDRDGAAHEGDELARDVQAEAAAAHASRHVRVGAVELLEDQALLVQRASQPLVANGDAEPPVAGPQLDLDPAAGG